MKKNQLLCTITVLCSSFLLLSCKKNLSPVDEKTATTATSIAQVALQATSGDCTPIALGVYSEANGSGTWTTIMQRFYDEVGTLTNIKAFITYDRFHYTAAWLNLQWGNVTFEDNQVYVRDGLTNKLIMRVTLNDSGLPEASYYYTDQPFVGVPGKVDTSYYYYDGNQLEHIFSSSRFNSDVTPNLQNNFWSLTYDSYGNIQTIGSNVPGTLRIRFSYDYNQPINGIITNYMLTEPLQLLELMGLLNLPMHYQPTKIERGLYAPGQGLPNDMQFLENNPIIFSDVVYTDGGQVYSYVDQGVAYAYHNTYYIGWHCLFFPPPGARMPNVIGELQGFKKQFPDK